jgi:hypothetical protein
VSVLLLATLVVGCSVDRAAIASDLRDASSGGNGAFGGSGGFGATGGFGGAGGFGATGGFGGVGGAGATGGFGGVVGDAGVDAAVHGYVPGAVGAPCSVDGDCMAAGPQRSCFTENQFAPILTLPGGYCSNVCDIAAAQPCEPGAACIAIPIGGFPLLMCMRTCITADECRTQAGYSCNMPFTSNTSVCSL